MGATPSHENDGDDVAGTDSDDDDDIIKIQSKARYRVSKINHLINISQHFFNWFDDACCCVCIIEGNDWICSLARLPLKWKQTFLEKKSKWSDSIVFVPEIMQVYSACFSASKIFWQIEKEKSKDLPYKNHFGKCAHCTNLFKKSFFGEMCKNIFQDFFSRFGSNVDFLN